MKFLNHPEKLAIRDANLRQIQQQGRYAWWVASGCTRQSLAENAVFRFKALFGPKLRARRVENKKAEGLMKCDILNRMTSLGMPVPERILSAYKRQRKTCSVCALCNNAGLTNPCGQGW